MKIENAFNRLSWRLSNGKFEPNQKDVDALKFLAEWVNRQKQESLQQHTIFAKMYVYCFMHELEFYKDLDFAQKKMHEILQQPAQHHYQVFLRRLNNLELEKFRKSIGLSSDHPLAVSDDTRGKDNEIISKHQEQLKKFVIGAWSEEAVTKAMNNQVTEAINKYHALP